MSKPDQPKTTVTVRASRTYVFSPDERRIVTDWKGGPLIALRVVITSNEGGKLQAGCTSAVGFRKDGTPGKQERRALSWWRVSQAPQWVQDLADDMPTPKVTLVPPKGKP